MPNTATIQLLGHIGRDVELSTTPKGDTLGRVSLAVSTGWGERKTTTWYRLTIWGKQATELGPYLLKGKAIYVEGEPSTSTWTSMNGKQMFAVEVRVSKVALIGGREDASHQQQPSTPEAAPEHEPDGGIPF